MTVSYLAFPSSLDELTPAWLTSALRQNYNNCPRVTGVKVSPISDGKGYLTVMAKAELDYEWDPAEAGISAPRSLIAKMQSPDPNARAICAATGIWKRECRFYADLAPKIPSRVARSYFVGADTEHQDYILLLEDLSAMTAGDQVKGVAGAQAEQVMDWVGSFHAACADERVAGTMGWLPTLDQFFASMQPQLQGTLPKYLEMYGDIISPSRAAVVSRVVPRFTRSLVASKLPPTVVHTDFRLDNMFFDAEGGAVVFDWQTLSVGQGLFDVAYFIVSNFSPEVRRTSEHELLAHYREALLGRGINPGSADDVFQAYRGQLLNVMGVSPIFSMLDTGSERSSNLFRNWVERIFAAAEDHNIAELIND